MGDVRFCSKCGSALEPDQSFCTGCGAKVGEVGGTLLGVGTVVREYRVLKLLGAGGAGEVYLAEHTLTSQRVAVKVLHPHVALSDAQRRRFITEAQVLADLSHENIVRLLGFFEERNSFFLVTEFVEGESLENMLEKGPLALPLILAVCRAVLGALGHAHSRTPAVFHRDIKPANILIRKDGRVVLTDFGIARQQGVKGMTKAGGLVGTPEYMSPEQVKGGEIGPSCDLYSLGVMLYEMLVGTVPFPQTDEDNFWPVLEAHVHQPPVRPAVPGLNQHFVDVVMRSLAKNPANRYASAEEMLAAVEAAITQRPHGPPRAAPATKAGAGETKLPLQPGPGVATSVQPNVAERQKTKRSPLIPALVAIVILGGLVAALAASGMFGGEKREANISMEAPTLEPTKLESKPVVVQPPTGAPQSTAEEATPLPETVVEKKHREEPPPVRKPAVPTSGVVLTTLRYVPSGKYPVTETSDKTKFEILRPICMDRYEATHASYQECVAKGPCSPLAWNSCIHLEESPSGKKSRETGRLRPSWHSDSHPAICVSPAEADVYCRWKGGRLPTTHEWEAAARGEAALALPWGHLLDQGHRANLCDGKCPFSWAAEPGMSDGYSYTAPVGSFPAGASPFGVEDMAGNVWEWTLTSKLKPAAKGGSWNSGLSDLLGSAVYSNVTAESRWNSIGFRCVYTADKCK